jgi:hypothetical protein
MGKAVWWGVIGMSLLLAACIQRPPPAPATSTPVQSPMSSTGIVTSPPTATLTPPTATPLNPAVVVTDQVTPSATTPAGDSTGQATPTVVEPTVEATFTSVATDTPTPMPATAQPHVNFFEVTPLTADPGETVTLSWSIQGNQATLCPSTRYDLFPPADCFEVPLSGSLSFTIPTEVGGNPRFHFLLTVSQPEGAEPVVWQVSVALKCARTWFFSDEPQAGICPTEALNVYAAAQRFERGLMIWLSQPGRYFILEDTILYAGEPRKRVSFVDDPLDISGDSSAEIVPPAGLFAPTSGFGLVWRGDVSQSPGYRESLGWALGPESGYQATYQCDDAPPSGGRSWRSCYLSGPLGEIFFLHPLGGWLYLEELPS